MTNQEAIGYMILAAKTYGLDAETIKRIKDNMRGMMDEYTEGEAEEAYYKP